MPGDKYKAFVTALFVINTKDWKQPKISINSEMNKQNVIYSWNGIANSHIQQQEWFSIILGEKKESLKKYTETAVKRWDFEKMRSELGRERKGHWSHRDTEQQTPWKTADAQCLRHHMCGSGNMNSFWIPFYEP